VKIMLGTRRSAPSHRRQRRAASARAFVGAPLLALLLTASNLPPTGIEDGARKLADPELSEMRGKFISPDGISYFGLQLETSWQGMDGITTYATVLFNVDFAQGAGSAGSPHLLVGWNRACADCGDAAMDVPGFGTAAQDGYVAIVSTGAGDIPVGGLQSVQGAVQSQAIAGADNKVLNDMRILVVPASAAMLPDASGLTELTASASKSFADGDKVQFILGSNQIGLALASGEGKDFILQNVDGDLNQIAQHVGLSSDLNMVRNSVAITVGLDRLKQLDQPQVANALSAMKGRGF
jgi:hypothetical protein